MKDQMPPVAQFSLPTKGQQPQQGQVNQPTQDASGMPPVATFSLPGNATQNTSQQDQDPGFIKNAMSGNIGGALNSAYKDVAQPLVGVAATPFQAGLAGYNKLTGSNIPDPFANGVPSIGGGNIPVSPLDVEKKIGQAAQVGSFMVPGSGLLSMVGAGALGGAGSSMAQGDNATDVTKQGVFGSIAGGAVGGLGKLLGMAGNKILNSIIKPSAADMADGFSMQTLKDNNLGGSLNQIYSKTKNLMSDLTTQLNQRLQNSGLKIDLASIYDKTVKDLTSKEGILGNFGQNSNVSRGLQKLEDEVLKANPSGSLSIPDAQTVKQASGAFGAWLHGSADPDATAIQTVFNKFYHNIKTAIEDASPAGVQDINSKISDLIPVMNAVIRRIPVADRNGGISLADMIGLVGTTMNPAAAIPTALEMASHSGVVGGLLSRFAPSIGKGLAPVAGQAVSGASGLLGQQK